MVRIADPESLETLKGKYQPKNYIQRYPKRIRNFLPYKYIWNKIHNAKEDCIIAVCGGTGKGKNTLVMNALEELDVTFEGRKKFPHFTNKIDLAQFDLREPYRSINRKNFSQIAPRFCYGASQVAHYWEWLKSLHGKGMKTAGICAAVDEVQTLWSAREFYSRKNRDAIKQFVTGRYLRTAHFLIGPEFSALDKEIQKRTHLVINVQGKGFDSTTHRAYISATVHIPIFLNPKNPPIFRWLRDRYGVIHDQPFYFPMPSKQLQALVFAKEIFWKNADKDEMGNVVDPSADIDLDRSQLKMKRILDAAMELKENRHEYLVKYSGSLRYSNQKIVTTNHFPQSWGAYIASYFSKWDQQENVDIQGFAKN